MDDIFEKWDKFLKERVSAMQQTTPQDYADEVNFILDTLKKETQQFIETGDTDHLLILRHSLRNALRKIRNQKR